MSLVGFVSRAAPARSLLVYSPKRKYCRHPDAVRLAPTMEMKAAHSVSVGGLKSIKAACHSSPRHVLQPQVSQLRIFGERIKVQTFVSMGIAIATRNTAGEARHHCNCRTVHRCTRDPVKRTTETTYPRTP